MRRLVFCLCQAPVREEGRRWAVLARLCVPEPEEGGCDAGLIQRRADLDRSNSSGKKEDRWSRWFLEKARLLAMQACCGKTNATDESTEYR